MRTVQKDVETLGSTLEETRGDVKRIDTKVEWLAGTLDQIQKDVGELKRTPAIWMRLGIVCLVGWCISLWILH